MATKEEGKARVLTAVFEFMAQRGYPPSYRDLGEELGMPHSQVHGYVRELRADGLIDERDPQVSRAITVSSAGRKRLVGELRKRATPAS